MKKRVAFVRGFQHPTVLQLVLHFIIHF